jgi:serine/threonine protein phosphatase 1
VENPERNGRTFPLSTVKKLSHAVSMVAGVTKLSKVKRCLHLPQNLRGRDLVVGDLHGHRSLLEKELDRLAFDPALDRVLSVGDLINRGPASLETLSLIEEPWFYAVLGNHELMLLNFLGSCGSLLHAGKSFRRGGGAWIADALSNHRKRVMRLADRVAALPLALHVQNPVPFNVTHGDLHLLGSRQERLLDGEWICLHKADAITSSRQNIAAAETSALLDLRFAQHEVRISPTPMGKLPITYVGHTPTRQVVVHNSYVYIDQGVGARANRRVADATPTVLEHRKFAHWLGGVASARGRPEADVPACFKGPDATRGALAMV